jgi:signal transduction histidine kinase
LGSLPAGPPELTRAIECIGRAGAFTREGLADARRAILALRGDSAPLAEQLSALASGYGSDYGADYGSDYGGSVSFTVVGTPRPVPAEAGLAAYRTAQEALTNARKHSPGQPVRLCLEFTDTELAVRVENPLGSSRSGLLASSGTGYGLTGLRERAALGGGTLEAGPADGQWQVWLRIPA